MRGPVAAVRTRCICLLHDEESVTTMHCPPILGPLAAAWAALARFLLWLWRFLWWRHRGGTEDVELAHLIEGGPKASRRSLQRTVNISASSLDEIVCVGGGAEAPLPRQLLPQHHHHGGKVVGQYGVHYMRYSIRTYVELPCALQPLASLPGLGSFLVVSRPTMDASAGLAGYKSVVPHSELKRHPFLVVVDKPHMQPDPSNGFYWVEFPLPDVFKLDVSGMRTFEDYVQGHLKRKTRRAWRVRQEELAGSPLVLEYIPLRAGWRSLVDVLWTLYVKNGERHGFHVTSKTDFYKIHLGGTFGLSVMLVRDTSRGGQIVTFATGVKSGDTLMSMWCGTDYDNPLSRSCSTYINSQYEFIRIAIEDPDIRWLDFGAQLRQMKTNIGAKGYPISGYVRCGNKLMRAMVQRMMQDYFDPSKLLEDA